MNERIKMMATKNNCKIKTKYYLQCQSVVQSAHSFQSHRRLLLRLPPKILPRKSEQIFDSYQIVKSIHAISIHLLPKPQKGFPFFKHFLVQHWLS